MVISAGSGTFLLGCTMLATWQAQNRKYLQSNYVDEEIFLHSYTSRFVVQTSSGILVKENVVISCCLVRELP